MSLKGLIIIVFVIPGLVFAQDPVDSLSVELRQTTRLQDRIPIYSQLIYELSFTDVSRALSLAEQVVKELATTEDTIYTANLNNSIGIAYNFNGNYLVSIEYFLKALEGYEQSGDSSRIANVLNNIGITYTEVKNYPNAEAFFKRSLDIHRKLNNLNEIAAVMNNLGDDFEDRGLIDSAEYYFRRSLQIAERNGIEALKADGYLNLGSVHYQKGEYTRALEYLEKAMRIDQKQNNLTGMVETYGLMGEIYLALGRYDLSRKNLKKALDLSQTLNMKNRESEIHLLFSKYFAAINNYQEAYASHRRYAELNDSIYSLEAKRQIEDLQLSYENSKKEQEIELLSERTSLQETQLHLQKTKTRLLLVFTLFTIFVLGLLMINIRTKSKANRLLKAQYDKIQQQNRELERRSNKLQELSEEKDNFISVVAHDLKSPLNNIAGLANLLRLNGKLSEEQLHYLNLLDQVSSEAKNLVTNLLDINKLESGKIEENYEEFDLVEVVDHVISSYRKDTTEKNININRNCSGIIKILNNREFIQRILDNLISNAIKFSEENTSVTVHCKKDEDQLILAVSDQGPGINHEDRKKLFKKFQKLSSRPTGGESSTGLGLAIVKLLVDKLHGRIEVISEEKKGSEFRVVFPASVKDGTSPA